jgi:hypothetical protein
MIVQSILMPPHPILHYRLGNAIGKLWEECEQTMLQLRQRNRVTTFNKRSMNFVMEILESNEDNGSEQKNEKRGT